MMLMMVVVKWRRMRRTMRSVTYIPTSSTTRSAHLEHSLKGLMGLLISEQCRSSSITNSLFLSSAKQSRESFSPAQKALVSAPLISENNCANAENQVRRVGTRRGG